MKTINKNQSARGGRRAGAGRKLGSATKRTREIADKAAKKGVAPLEYMLKVMRDPKADKARRDEMAKAAAPYIHSKLANTQIIVSGTLTLRQLVEQAGKDDAAGG